MKIFFLTVCTLVILFSFPKFALASCGVKPSISVAVKEADVIFIGTVRKIEATQIAGGALPVLAKKPKWEKYLVKVDVVTFSVSEAFKGLDSETIDVTTGADGFAGYKFEGGTWLKERQTYLVYAYKRRPASKEIPKKLAEEINELNSRVSPIESNVCTRTVNANFAGKELEQVRRIFPKAKRFDTQADARQFNADEAETATTLFQRLLSLFGLA